MAIEEITKYTLYKKLKEFKVLKYEESWDLIEKWDKNNPEYIGKVCIDAIEEFLKWFYQFGVLIIRKDKK